MKSQRPYTAPTLEFIFFIRLINSPSLWRAAAGADLRVHAVRAVHLAPPTRACGPLSARTPAIGPPSSFADSRQRRLLLMPRPGLAGGLGIYRSSWARRCDPAARRADGISPAAAWRGARSLAIGAFGVDRHLAVPLERERDLLDLFEHLTRGAQRLGSCCRSPARRTAEPAGGSSEPRPWWRPESTGSAACRAGSLWVPTSPPWLDSCRQIVSELSGVGNLRGG